MPASLCCSVCSGWMFQITVSFHVYSERHSSNNRMRFGSVQSAGRILHCVLCTLQRFEISMQCVVVSANMSLLPNGCSAVQWAMWKGGSLTSHDRLYRSENYLVLQKGGTRSGNSTM